MPALHPLPHDAPVSGTGAGRRAAVLFSAHPWQGNPYGLHHIARALAGQGRPVLFVEPPFSPLHLLANRRRGRQFSRSLRQSGVENILLFSPFSLLPYVKLPLLGSKLGLALWPKFALNSFASSVRGTQFERPGVAISGAALFSQFIFALDAEFRGFRLADYDMLFDTVPESLRVQTRSELKRYDAVFASTAILAQAARAAGARQVVSMPNGFEGSGFRGDFVVPNDLARLPSPRIVYVGAMEKWFDWNALTYAAAALPNASFVIIGDSGSEPRPLPRNVHMLGLRPHSKVGAYLRNCDIGIIPFKFDPNRRTQH